MKGIVQKVKETEFERQLQSQEKEGLRKYLSAEPEIGAKVKQLEQVKSDLEARIETLQKENYRLKTI